MTTSRLELLIGSLTSGIDVFAKGGSGGGGKPGTAAVDEREVAMSEKARAKGEKTGGGGGGGDVEME